MTVKLSQTVLQFPKVNAAALTAVDDTLVTDGVLAYVISLKGMFKLNKSSTETVNSFSVIATNSGTGRWISAGVRVYAAANQAAMLALTVKPGDIAIRSDLNNTLFIRTEGTSGTVSDWESVLSDAPGFNGIFVVTGDTTVLSSQNNYLLRGDFTSAHNITISPYASYPANFSFQYQVGELYPLTFLTTSPDLLDGLPYFVAPVNSSGRIYKDAIGNWHVTENVRPFANVTLINTGTYGITGADHGSTIIINNEIDVDIPLPQQSDENLPIGFYFNLIPGLVKLGTLVANGSDVIAGNKHFNGRQPVIVVLSATVFGANIWTVANKSTTSTFEIPDVAADYQIANPPYSYYIYNGTLRTGFILPSGIDVSSMHDGDSFTISNQSALTLPIKFFSGTTFFASLAPNNVAVLTLIDGSTEDCVWDIAISSSAAVGALGTMAYQDADAIAVSGGTMNGTTLGGTTPAQGTFTQLLGALLNIGLTASNAFSGTVGTAAFIAAFTSTITDSIYAAIIAAGGTTITGSQQVAAITGGPHSLTNCVNALVGGWGTVNASSRTGILALNYDPLTALGAPTDGCGYIQFTDGSGLIIIDSGTLAAPEEGAPKTPKDTSLQPYATLDVRGTQLIGALYNAFILGALPANTASIWAGTERADRRYFSMPYADPAGVNNTFNAHWASFESDEIEPTASDVYTWQPLAANGKFRPLIMIVRLTAYTGTLVNPLIFSVGTNAATFDNLLASHTFNAFTTVDEGRDVSVDLTKDFVDLEGMGVIVNVTQAPTGVSAYKIRISMAGFFTS